MATKEFTLKKKTEIPSTKLAKFNEAINMMEEYDESLALIESDAKAIKITDQPTFVKAAALMTAKKEIVKNGEALIKPYKKILNDAKKFVLEQEHIVTNHGAIIDMVLEPKLDDWLQREERERKAEEARKQADREAQLKREADAKRIADEEAAQHRKKVRIEQIRQMYKNKEITKRESEKLLREAGATAEADLAKASADADEAIESAAEKAKELVVHSSVPKTGLRNARNYYAECEDEDAFLRAFVVQCNAHKGFGDLRQFIKVDNQKLGEVARKLRNSTDMRAAYIGVKAWDEPSF